MKWCVIKETYSGEKLIYAENINSFEDANIIAEEISYDENCYFSYVEEMPEE